MSVYCGLKFFVLTAEVESALDATMEIARGRKRGEFYELTLPSGATIETPFRETFDPPPYTLAVGGETLLFDIDVICELDERIRDVLGEDHDYPMKPRRDGSCRIKLPVALHLKADVKYTLVEFGSDLSDVGTILQDTCSLRDKIEFVFAYAGGVARLLDANGVLYTYPDTRPESRPWRRSWTRIMNSSLIRSSSSCSRTNETPHDRSGRGLTRRRRA